MAGYQVNVVKIINSPNAVYIGRTGFGRTGSPLQNKHKILPGTQSRHEAIVKYEVDFYSAISNGDKGVINELLRIHEIGLAKGYVELGCFCRPEKECHGDTIARFLMDNYDWLEETKANLT